MASPIEHRSYGEDGPHVVVLHGGPGAVGYMAPLARALADRFRVIEPLQRRSGGARLTVSGHVADLHGLLTSHLATHRPALVGSSWGAMLALAFAAEHPKLVGPIVLVGCGTFDERSRARFNENLEARLDGDARRRLRLLPIEISDPDRRLATMGDILLPFYSHELISDDLEVQAFDARGFHESWQDMVRLQAEGIYPTSFEAVESDVLMLHGDEDPHPGEMIFESLRSHLTALEYRELKLCGHYPWLERYARDVFFDVLRSWLFERLLLAGSS